MQQITLLSHSILSMLEHDLELPGGQVIQAGMPVCILPETLAQCVLMPDGRTLAEFAQGVDQTGHTHTEIIGLAEQMIRMSSRLAAIEQEKI